MERMMIRRLFYVAAVVAVTLCARSYHAALSISNIQLTDTTLAFDIAGTVDVVGDYGQNQLYLGELGNTSWVNSYSAGIWTDGGGTVTMVGAEVNSLGAGDYAIIGGPQSMIVGDTIQGSFSLTGSFNAGSTTTSNWVVSAGYSTKDFEALPDPNTITGSAVPEPSSGLFALILAAAAVIRRRR